MDSLLVPVVVAAFNLLVAVGVGVIGFFMRATIARAEHAASAVSGTKTEVQALRGEIGVLRERMNGVVAIKDELNQLRVDLRADFKELQGEVRNLYDRIADLRGTTRTT